MSAEFIVFDNSSDENAIEIAMQEASRAGMKPSYFRNAGKAVEAVGFFTRGVVTSPGLYSRLENQHEGLALIKTANLLEVPKAIFEDDDAETMVGSMMNLGRPDVFVPRAPYQDVESVLRNWIASLPTAA